MANEQAVTVGAVAFRLGLDPSSLGAAINSVSQQINAQLTRSFRTACSGCEQSINELGQSMTQMSNSIANTVSSGARQISDTVNSGTNRLSENITGAARGSENLGREVKKLSGSIGETLTGAVKRFGAALVSAFAIRQVARFTQSCVEAAAAVKALNAQVEQTFGTLQGDALSAIRAVAQESGILETRLQGAGAQMYAFAKAARMDSVTALNMMKEALQVTADSAAFYDRSLEDTAESLRSFLKGNYANDAALGISCTETTRNTAANKLYGKSFRELSEAQKQLTLLQMVKDANELSGAMGQAAREADGWENVTGNLKESWKQFKAAIGQPVLQALVPILQNITAQIQTMTDAAKQATAALSELFGRELVTTAENTGGAITDIAKTAADAESNVREEIDKSIEKEKENANSLASFDKLNVLSSQSDDSSSSDEGDDTAESAQLAKAELNDLKSSIASVDLEPLKRRIKEAMEFFEPLTSSVRRNVETTVENARNGIDGYLRSFGGEVDRYSARIGANLADTARQTRNGIVNILNESTKSQQRMSGELSQGYTDILGGASVFSLSFADVFTGMLDITSGSFEEWTQDNSELLGGFFDGLNGTFANLLTTVGTILEDIGTRLTEWWDGTGAAAFKNFTDAIFDVGAVILDIWQSYVLPFVNYVIDSVAQLWDEHLAPLWSGVLDLLSSLWDAVAAIWNRLLRPLYDTFIKRIMVGVMGALKSVWDIVYGLFAAVVDIVKGVVRVAKGLLDFITGVFTGDIDKAFDGINDMFCGLIDAIWGAFKGVLNTIIGAMNTVWSAIYGVIKSIVDGIGDFVGMIGDLSGKNWYFSMPDEVPRIPRLAQGGIVRAPTIAVVGDNPNASRDPEVVSPLSKLSGLIESRSPQNSQNDETLMQILSYMKMIYETCKDGKNIELDGRAIFKSMIRQSDAHKRTHGRSPFL